MSNLFIELKEKLQQNRLKKIVFPEAYDERILQAASILAKEKLLLPVLIGQQKEITRLANTLNV
ncbi:MAG TPA: phosphate acyltransferase, partial [Pseudogracilibacillus sp.]|nr:phosphate acyltransferase [Pseudogracilibacillus sp.]